MQPRLNRLSRIKLNSAGFRRLWRRISEASPARKVLVVAGITTFAIGVTLLTMGIMSVTEDDSPEVVSSVPRLPPDSDLDLVEESPSSSPSPSPTQAATASPSPTPEPTPVLPQDGYRLVIDRLGIDGVVDTYGLDENAVPIVPTGENAGQVIAWYDFSARPGEGSNAVFAGHNSWFGSGIFAQLHILNPGDEVRLIGGDGREMLYTISDVFSVDPENPDSLRVMRPTNEDVITLITCGGTFVDTDDPVFGGEFTDRVVVRAELTSVSEAAVSAVGG